MFMYQITYFMGRNDDFPWKNVNEATEWGQRAYVESHR